MPDMLAWFLLAIHYAGHVVKTQVARANGEKDTNDERTDKKHFCCKREHKAKPQHGIRQKQNNREP
jgi:hypothetical protein